MKGAGLLKVELRFFFLTNNLSRHDFGVVCMYAIRRLQKIQKAIKKRHALLFEC